MAEENDEIYGVNPFGLTPRQKLRVDAYFRRMEREQEKNGGAI